MEWRFHSESNGHLWQAGYHNGMIVSIRCANCKKVPIEVLNRDFTTEFCLKYQDRTNHISFSN